MFNKEAEAFGIDLADAIRWIERLMSFTVNCCCYLDFCQKYRHEDSDPQSLSEDQSKMKKLPKI